MLHVYTQSAIPTVYTQAVPQLSMVPASTVPVIPTLMASMPMPPSTWVSSRSNKGLTSKYDDFFKYDDFVEQLFIEPGSYVLTFFQCNFHSDFANQAYL